MLSSEVQDQEFLYRGIVTNNWDFENDRPSSATFKDSKGVSVDRDGERTEEGCIKQLQSVRDFHAICKVLAKDVRELNALVLYKKVENNEYHSEIHDSLERIPMRGRKPRKIREKSKVVRLK